MSRKGRGARAPGPLGPGARVCIYARDSGHPNQDRSTADQVAEATAYAEAQGWVVARTFVDDARSGLAMENREQFLELLALCRQAPPPVDGVLVWSLSRLGRNEMESQFIMADLGVRGVGVVSVTERIPAEFSGIFQALIRWKDARFIEDLRASVLRGHRRNTAAGFPTGRPPVGYRREPVVIGTRRDGKPHYASRWVVDEVLAPAVRKAFEMRAQGYSLAEVMAATRLHDSPDAYARLFACKTYKGTLTYGEEEWPGALDAIVTADLWQAAQAARRFSVRRQLHTYLLTGLLECGVCGGRMCGQPSTSGPRDRVWGERREYSYRYYVCLKRAHGGRQACDNPRAPCEKVDAEVLAQVSRRLLEPRSLWELVEGLRQIERTDSGQAEMVALEAEAGRKRQAIERLLDLAEDGADVRARVRERRAELAELEARRAGITRQAQVLGVSYAEVEAFCAYLRGELATDDLPRCRRMLRQLISRVVVAADGMVEVRWCEGLPRALGARQ